MGDYRVPPDLNEVIKNLKKRIQDLALTQAIRVYTVATLPANPGTGHPIVFVSDAPSGQRFQGWDTTAAAWVPLG